MPGSSLVRLCRPPAPDASGENRGSDLIYDYVDSEVPILRKMFEKRLRGYSAIGYVLDDESQDLRPSAEDVGREQEYAPRFSDRLDE